MIADGPLLEVTGLRKSFLARAGNGSGRIIVPAVDGVSFRMERARTTALVGESGSGKSTLARLIMGLYRTDAGSVTLSGTRIDNLRGRQLRSQRRNLQMVFQNPLLSFDPMLTIGTSVREVARLSTDPQATSPAAIAHLLGEVGLSTSFARLLPRGVSGGELQRAAIARAISAHPELVVLDEPTSALDVSIQGQVLNLLRRLQDDRGIGYLLATHDLKVVRLISHEVLVLYLGQIVEMGPTSSVLGDPRHPYTAGLVAAESEGRVGVAESSIRISGALTYPAAGYAGCRLVGRCPLAIDRCHEPQPLLEVSAGHLSRCWRAVEPLPSAASEVASHSS